MFPGQGQPHQAYGGMMPGRGQPTAPAGAALLQVPGALVHFRSIASKKTIRMHSSGAVSGDGGKGKFATWKVHVPGPGLVKLQSVAFPKKFLRIGPKGGLNAGSGGTWCNFAVVQHDTNTISLRSVRHAEKPHHVGILPSSQAKNGARTGTGPHGRFIVIPKKVSAATVPPATAPVMWPQPPQGQPMYPGAPQASVPPVMFQAQPGGFVSSPQVPPGHPPVSGMMMTGHSPAPGSSMVTGIPSMLPAMLPNDVMALKQLLYTVEAERQRLAALVSAQTGGMGMAPAVPVGMTMPGQTFSAFRHALLENGFAAQVHDGSGDVGYFKDTLGFVHLSGLVQGGRPGSTVFTLPADCRPDRGRKFAVPATFSGDRTFYNVHIYPDGRVVNHGALHTPSPYDSFSLCGCVFIAADSVGRMKTVSPTFLPGWKDNGGSWMNAKVTYGKDANGWVRLSGLVAGGVPGMNIFQLPAGYRPARGVKFCCCAYYADGFQRTMNIHVTRAGFVVPVVGDKPANFVDISLDGVVFIPPAGGTDKFERIKYQNGFKEVTWEGAASFCMRDSRGMCRLTGITQATRGGVDTVMTVLPQGYRPVRGGIFSCQAMFKDGRRGHLNVAVHRDGRIMVYARNKPSDAFDSVALDGIFFEIAK